MTNKDAFITGYIATIAWLAISHDGGDDGLTPDDLPNNITDTLTTTAAEFYDTNLDLITDTLTTHATPDTATDLAYNLGSDFALTRNRHGTGFWDRGLGTHGTALTDLAHPYGDSAIHIDADGNITLTD